MIAKRIVFAMAILAACGSSSQAQDDDAKGSGENRGSDSLLSWLTGRDNPDEKPPSQRRIATERPDFSFATTTVGKGRVVLETGYSYLHDDENGANTRLHSYPEALLRIGLFTEWFEVQFGQNVIDARRTLADGTTERASGAQDLLVGLKFGLSSEDKWIPESSLLVTCLVPTGSSSLTNEDLMPGLFYSYSWTLIEDKFFIAGSTGGTRLLESTGNRFYEFLQTAEGIVQFSEKLNGYGEVAGFMPAGSQEVKPRYVFNSGLLYYPNENMQLDIYAGFGLNREAPDLFGGVGFSVRY